VRHRRIGQREGVEVRLDNSNFPFKTLPRRAHPGAEDARMGGGLVVRMVRRMLHGLDVHQAAEQQQADRGADGDRLLKDSTHRDIAGHVSGIGHPCQGEKCGGVSYRIPVKNPVY